MQAQSQAADLVGLFKKGRERSSQYAATVKSQIGCLEPKFKVLGLEQKGLTRLVKDLNQKPEGFETTLHRAEKQQNLELSVIKKRQELKFANIEGNSPKISVTSKKH